MSNSQNKSLHPLLSICIPTYDRSNYLDYLLSNITEQIGVDSNLVEIIVSDNFSKDSTNLIIQKHQLNSLNLKYIRNYKNSGVANNLTTAIVNSSAKYCWLMGDDDALRDGALPYILEAIKSYNPDVIVANRYVCDSNLNLLYPENFLPEISQAKIFDFNYPSNILDYFGYVKNTTGMFNFISTLIIKKEEWIRSLEPPSFAQNLFPHVYKIIDILYNRQSRLLFLPEQIVLARTGNDRLDEFHGGSSFMSWQLHFKGNIELADHFFKTDQEVYDAFLSPIKSIISKGKEHYISLANNDGYYEEAVRTLKKLNIN